MQEPTSLSLYQAAAARQDAFEGTLTDELLVGLWEGYADQQQQIRALVLQVSLLESKEPSPIGGECAALLSRMRK